MVVLVGGVVQVGIEYVVCWYVGVVIWCGWVGVGVVLVVEQVEVGGDWQVVVQIDG